MKALLKYAAGPGSMEVREMPEPSIRPGHVIIEVEAAAFAAPTCTSSRRSTPAIRR